MMTARGRVTAALALMVCAAPLRAQDRVAEAMRKGIVEEDLNRNLPAAILDYQIALGGDGSAAATAWFRIAECNRKLGNREEAIAAYTRVVRFAGRSRLAQESSDLLATVYKISVQPVAQPAEATAAAARRQYRGILEEAIGLARSNLNFMQQQSRAGEVAPRVVDQARRKLVDYQDRLAAFDAGLVPGASATPKASAARAQHRKLLQTLVDQARKNLQTERNMYRIRSATQQEMNAAQAKWIDARLALAALDAGLAQAPAVR